MDFAQKNWAHKIKYIDKYFVDIRAYVILKQVRMF